MILLRAQCRESESHSRACPLSYAYSWPKATLASSAARLPLGIHSSHSAVTGRLESNITRGYGQFTQDSGSLSPESQLQGSRKGLETACIFRKTTWNLLLAVLFVITFWARKGTEQPAVTSSLSPWSLLSSHLHNLFRWWKRIGRGFRVTVPLCPLKLQKRDSTN